MVFVRIVLLSFWAFFAWSMDRGSATLNDTGNFIVLSFFLAVPLLYLLPTYEAWQRQHPSLVAIALVNVFLGWSLVGWIVAIAWAYARPHSSLIAETPVAMDEYGKCPFCAERVRKEAIKCKHCGSAIAARAPSSVG